MRPYVFKIASGAEESEFFGDGANYVRLDESATVSVTVKSPDNNEQVTLKAGDDVVLTPFDELRLSHDGAGDTVFTLYVGRNTRLGGARIGGSVQVTGGSGNTASPPFVNTRVRDAKNGNHFIMKESVAWPELSITNPAGSGYDIFVWSMLIYGGSSGSVDISESSNEAGITTIRKPTNRLLGGRQSVANFQYAATNGVVNLIGDQLQVLYGSSAVDYNIQDVVIGGPVVIPEGKILGIHTTGSPFLVFDYEEVPK